MEEYFDDSQVSDEYEESGSTKYHGYVSEPGSHNTICTKCNKYRKRAGNYLCQKCIDFRDFNIQFEKIDELNRKSAKKKDSIKHKKELVTQLQEEIKQIRTLIREENLELQKIDHRLFIEKQSIQMSSETVSEDVRKYRAHTSDMDIIVLETHCTIVRPDISQEDVYFGHVTLIITIGGVDYKCRYGIEMYNKLPHSLNHKFWIPPENGVSHSRLINEFANFIRYFPEETTLSDIMESHFQECYKAFDRSQWSNQIWRKDDTIKDERAPKLLKRLRKEEVKRQETKYLGYIDRARYRLQQEEESKVKLKVKKPRMLQARLATQEEDPEEDDEDDDDEDDDEEVQEADSLAREQEDPEEEEDDEDDDDEEVQEADSLAREQEDPEEEDDEDEQVQEESETYTFAEYRAIRKQEADSLAREQAAREEEADSLAREQAAREEEADKEEDLYLDELILANKIIKELSEKVSNLNDKLTTLCKMDFKTDRDKELKSTLAAEYTECLEEVDKNIETINNFPRLQCEDKKDTHDGLSQLQEKLNTGIGVLNLVETNRIDPVDSRATKISEFIKEMDKFREEEDLIDLTSSKAEEALGSLIWSLSNLKKKADIINDEFSKTKIKTSIEVYGLIKAIDVKRQVYSKIIDLIKELSEINILERKVLRMSGEERDQNIPSLIQYYRTWTTQCANVTIFVVKSILTDKGFICELLEKLTKKIDVSFKYLLRELYKNNKIENEDNKVIIENLLMLVQTRDFELADILKFVTTLRDIKHGELTTNDILDLIDKKEEDQKPDIKLNDLIKIQVAIDDVNKIIEDLKVKVFSYNCNINDLLKIDRKSDSDKFKQHTVSLIYNMTKYLEEINKNIQILNTFPNLPVTAKKEAHDTLEEFKDTLDKKIQYIKKLVAVQKGEKVVEQTQDELQLFYTIIEDLSKEIDTNMTEQFDLFTDEADKAITSLIVKLDNFLTKINANIKLLKQNKIILKSDLDTIISFFDKISYRIESIILYVNDISFMKKSISEIMLEEKKLTSLVEKAACSKQRRLLIDKYKQFIKHCDITLGMIEEQSMLDSDRKMITDILVKAREEIEIRLAKVKKMEEDYIRSFTRN